MAASPDLMRSYVELVKSPVARPGVDESLKANRDTAIIAESAIGASVLVQNDYYGVRAQYADFATELTNALRTVLQGGTDTTAVMTKLQEDLTAKGITP